MKDSLPSLLGIGLGLLAFYGLLFAFGITCPIKALTGISCPGCGMTRAWLSLARGDLALAFTFHPLFLLPPLAIVLFLCRRRLPRSLAIGLLILGLVLVLGLYVLRLMDPSDSIVVCRPEEGYLFRPFFRLF